MFNITQLVGIPQLGVHSGIERLVEVFAEASSIKGQTVPVVSVYLKSGQYLQGYIIGFNTGPEKKSVLIANYRQNNETPQDLSYVLLEEITGFTVHQADTVVDQLSSGQINLSLKKIPSAEEVNTHLQNFVNDFNRRLGSKITANISSETVDAQKKNELEALYFCVTDWTRAMRKHANDEIVQQTFRDGVFKFNFSLAAVAKIDSADGSNIEIVLGKQGEKLDRVSRLTIEAKLKELV